MKEKKMRGEGEKKGCGGEEKGGKGEEGRGEGRVKGFGLEERGIGLMVGYEMGVVYDVVGRLWGREEGLEGEWEVIGWVGEGWKEGWWGKGKLGG